MGSVELERVENNIINFIEYTCTLYVEISKSMIWTSFGIERYENQRMELRLGKSRTFQHLLSTGLKMGTVCTLQRRSNWDFREINPSPPPLFQEGRVQVVEIPGGMSKFEEITWRQCRKWKIPEGHDKINWISRVTSKKLISSNSGAKLFLENPIISFIWFSDRSEKLNIWRLKLFCPHKCKSLTKMNSRIFFFYY